MRRATPGYKYAGTDPQCMAEELAAMQCNPDTLQQAIGTAALAVEGHDPSSKMFVRLRPGYIDTPASAVDAQLGSYCTFDAALFEEFTVFESSAAVLPVGPALDWLEYFADDSLTVSVLGETGAEYASAFRFASERRTATLDCIDPTTVLDAVEVTLPDRFEEGQYVDDDRHPLPTTAETSAAELGHLVAAAEHCQVDSYPLTLDDGLRFEVDGAHSTASGTLAGSVEGPPVSHQFGPEFARIVRALDGQVTLQTGPDQPLVVRCTDPGVTYRFVLAPEE